MFKIIFLVTWILISFGIGCSQVRGQIKGSGGNSNVSSTNRESSRVSGGERSSKCRTYCRR